MNIKVLFSITATTIAVVSYVPYIKNIAEGKTKPHAFSWFIWAIITYIAGGLQLAEGGGIIGASVALVTATISMYIACIAIRQKAVKITFGDWVSLALSLFAIVLWLVTDRPLASAILICVIDFFAFWPTIRKSFNNPHQETLSTQILSAVKHCLTVLAQQKYTLVAVLFPLTIGLTTTLFSIMLIVRRKQLNLYPGHKSR